MRYLLAALGLVVLLAVAAVIAGTLLPVKHRATQAALFHMSRANLAAIMLDVSQYPAWRTGVRSVETLTANGSDIRYREASSDGNIDYRMDTSGEPARLVSRITGGVMAFGGSWTYELTPQGDATELRITEDGAVYNPVFRLVSRFINGHNTTITRYLADLERRVGRAP